MTELLNDVGTPSDAELISRVRGGDVAAYGILFSRHRDAANRLSRQLVRGPDADDLVSEAFAKVLVVLQGGGGPDVAFRAYLLTAVRRLHVDRLRLGKRLQTTDDMTPFDPGVPFQDTAVAGFETGAAAKAFASLPERWQLVLWHLEVEGQKPADIAPLLGMSPNSVSALAYRAREGLRQAFLTMHLSDISETDCRWVNEHLGAFVRKGLAKRDAAKVQAHLDGCRRCTAMHLELTEVNSNLAAIIAPLLLGAAAAGYLASTTGVSALGVLSLVSRAKEFAVANTGGVVAGAVSVGVAAAAVVAVAVAQSPGGRPDVVADPPAGVTTSLVESPGAGTTTAPATGSTDRPTTGRTPTLTSSPSVSSTPTAGTTTSPTPSASGSLLPSSTPSASSPAALPSFDPTLPVVESPATPAPDPTGSESVDPPPTDPSPQTPAEPVTPDRVIGDPVVSPEGAVTIPLGNLRADDVLDVTMDSADTTFTGVQADARCSVTAPRHITCTFPDPAVDESVALTLDFPGYMVEDDLQVTATVAGAPAARSVRSTFRPSRTPSFDFTAPAVGGTPTHSVSGDVDRFRFTTTALLPPRVRGLVYTLVGAGFDPAGAGPCTVADEARVMTCPDVRDGDQVDVPVVAESLDAVTDVELSVAPVLAFDDPQPDGRTTSLRLRPGADLGLDLSVLSANPGRNGLVSLAGTVSGLRAGVADLTYTITGGATFENAAPAGCTAAGQSMTCPSPGDGRLAFDVRPDRRNEVTPITIEVTPSAPFEIVGAGPHTTALTLPGRAVHDFSLADLAVAGHTLASSSGDTDVYTLTGTVGALPPGSSTVGFSLVAGGVFAADQSDPACRLDATPERGGQVVCAGLAVDDRVSFVVESTATATHDASVEIQATDPFDDLDPTNNTRTVRGLRPGTHLVLTPRALGDLHQNTAGSYRATTAVTGLRPGVEEIRVAAGDGASIDASRSDACSLADTGLVCTGLADGDEVSFTVASDTPARRTPLAVTASPGGDFLDLYDDRTATGTLVPTWNFVMSGLTPTGHTLSGDGDEYSLSSVVRRTPPGLDTLTFRLTDGGTFAGTQDTGCTRLEDRTRVRCDGIGDGRTIDFRVTSASLLEHLTRIELEVPEGYDDPAADDQAGSVTLQPGVDLTLADLDPDNESPANDDSQHLVTTRLGGVRAGLSQVTYTLSGNATFVGADRAGCLAAGTTVTCEDPVDGELTFTVRATDARVATPIAIAVAADGFQELDPTDNTERARLAVAPTYDFSVGALELVGQTLAGGTDQYTLRATTGAVPDGVTSLTFEVSGGTLATDQPAGCRRLDATHAACDASGTERPVDLRLDSDTGTEHPVVVTVQPPRRYVDPGAGNDRSSLVVRPGVDLHVGALTPADPAPIRDTYRLGTVLTGVRDAPVTFTISGAVTVTDSSCAVVSTSRVSCASPSEGQQVTFTLASEDPLAAAAVTVTASPDPSLLELDESDNAASTSLAPDLVLDSVAVTRHRTANQQVVVRAQVSGVPRGLAVLRMQLSGAAVDTGRVHFTDGVSGADGEGPVDCYTSDAVGTAALDGRFATCTGIASVAGGSFYVDMRVAHPHGRSSPVTFTVVPVGADEGTHGPNNARSLTLQ